MGLKKITKNIKNKGKFKMLAPSTPRREERTERDS